MCGSTSNHTSKITSEVKRMTEIKNLLIELQELKEENQSLKLDNDFLQRQNNALKMRCSSYCLQVRDLEAEIKDMKFTRNYLTGEEAGKAFARELLGKPMTPSDIAEEQFIENGEKHYEKTWNLACEGDDF